MSMQRVLDPGTMGTPGQRLTIAVAPLKCRDFGHVPDVTAMQPGDLVLFGAVKPTWNGRIVVDAQRRGGFAEQDCQWSHVAVYLYDWYVVEALPWHGVIQRNILEYVPGFRMRIRRAPALAMEDRYRIALRALSMFGQGYSHLGIGLLYLDLLRGLWSAEKVVSSPRINICSRVFHDAHAAITRRQLRECPFDRVVTPAHLSATPDLDDVEVGWAKII
ncbi:hypothetical protein [Xanthobacter pseudotagetidis]|uniref:hypothetical protein n=1 Tax=Xanthobacter pseudotagetidis TaxID=3119911 RepID=UPI003727485A